MQRLRNKVLQTLHSSEPFFKLDVVYATKSGFWTTLSFFVGSVASVITMIAFGNLLPRETFGIYNYLLSLGASLSFLTLSGTGPAVMRAVARGYESVVPHALRLQLKYNLVAVFTTLIVGVYYGYRGNFLFAGSLAMLAVAYPLSEAFHIYKQVLIGRKHFKSLTKITSVIAVVGTITTVIVLALTDDVFVLITVYALMTFLPSIIAYRLTTRNTVESLDNPEQIKEMKHTSFHLTGAGIIGVIASYIDKVLLFQVAGPVALAVYGFALAGPERLKSLIKNWMSVALPRLAQKPLKDIHTVIYKRIALSVLVGFLLFAAYFLFIPLLFQIFLPHYLDAIVYSQALALGLIVVPVPTYIGSIFASQNMLRANYILSIGSHISRILLFLVFGWLWQIWGLVIAFLSSYILNAILSIVIWELESKRIISKL